MAIGPNDLVTKLAAALLPPPVGAAGKKAPPAGTPVDLAKAPHVPELVVFAGFLGANIKDPGGADWRLLYLDLRLLNWLLVEEGGILYNDTIEDDKVPGKRRDVIWVDADAAVGKGSGSQSVQARFLTGEFTRAGDFDAPLTGATLSASTGVFCEAKTPLCCTRHSR